LRHDVGSRSLAWQTTRVPRPWTLVDSADSPEGALELRQRGTRDFMITVAGRVLMSSTFTRSEVALAELACARVREREAPRVLIGGLGLGYTLRAALDALPASAHVAVAELNPVVIRWCRGPASVLSGSALADARVEVIEGDVTRSIRDARCELDAIVLDLYVGPGPILGGTVDPLYGAEILGRTYDALRPGGVYAVWGENPDAAFERRLRHARFDVERKLVRGGGPTHVVHLATKRA
jgi:spermidine synthase